MTVRVRELQRGEALLWKRLRLRALAESPDAFAVTYDSDVGRPNDSWHSMIDASAKDPFSTSLVAEAGRVAIGMAYCRLDPTDNRVGQVFAMWVDPSYRGQSAGRALLQFALQWMRDREATTSELSVTETNRAAIRLYESAGYLDTGERESLREGSDLQVVKMSCPLANIEDV